MPHLRPKGQLLGADPVCFRSAAPLKANAEHRSSRPDGRLSPRLAYALLLVAALLVPSRADADEPRIDLSWQSTSCSSADEVLAEAHRILGGPPKLERSVEVLAEVTTTAAGFRLGLTTHVGPAADHRSAEDASCTVIRDAAALMIALTVQTAQAEENARREERPPAARPPSAPPGRSRATDHVAPRPARLRFVVGGGPLFDVGTLGGLTNGLELRARVEGVLLLEVFGDAFLPHVAAVGGAGRAGIRVQLLSAGARLCAPVSPASVALQLCASGEVVVAHGSSFGVPIDLPAGAVWSAWGPAIRARLPIAGRTHFSVGLQGLISVDSPRYALELDGVARTILHPQLGARLGFGYEFDVP